MDFKDEMLDALEDMDIETMELSKEELDRITELQNTKMKEHGYGESNKKKRIPSWRKYSAVAAACVLAVGTVVIFQNKSVSNIGGTTNIKIEANTGDQKGEGSVGIAGVETGVGDETVTGMGIASETGDKTETTELPKNFNNIDDAKKVIDKDITLPQTKEDEIPVEVIVVENPSAVKVEYKDKENENEIVMEVKRGFSIMNEIEGETIEVENETVHVKTVGDKKVYTFIKDGNKYTFTSEDGENDKDIIEMIKSLI